MITDSPPINHRPTNWAGRGPGCTDLDGLPERVSSLVRAVAAEERLAPTTACRLLSQSEITAADLEPWADFDHPKEDSYGRKMLYDGGHFELMVMSWAPGDMAAIHDHGYTQWGAVKMFGAAEHAIFRLEDGVLTTADRRVLEAGSVVAVNHELIHQMGNVGALKTDQAPFLSLHLYGCNGHENAITADARLYELDEGTIQITSGGVFFALPESSISRRAEAPQADFPTVLRFKVELLRRLLSINDTRARQSFQCEREARLAEDLFAPERWAVACKDFASSGSAAGSHIGDPLRREQYLGILHQELAAAAQLQLELIDADLVDSEVTASRDRLEAIRAT